ncbi:ABC transporter permease [Chloroflexota bacterium]
MLRAYIIRRILLVPPTLFLVALMVFLMVQLIPGSAVEQMLSQLEYQFRASDVQAMKEAMGVDVPIHVQFVRWMGNLVRGDLGNSLWNNRPVLQDLMTHLPVSLELVFLSILSGMMISLPIGIYSSVKQDTWGDYIARSLAIGALAIPTFWLGTIVMVFPSIWWDWSPALEYIPFTEDPIGNLVQFIIPSIILGFLLSGTVMRMTRTMMLEVLRQDYIRTAWSKGLSERVIIMRHALKNALIPVVTIIGLQFSIIVGTAVVIEQIFVLPGLGRYLLQAITKRDYVALAGVNMFVATAVLFLNLAVDISYAFLDPRVQYK